MAGGASPHRSFLGNEADAQAAPRLRTPHVEASRIWQTTSLLQATCALFR